MLVETIELRLVQFIDYDRAELYAPDGWSLDNEPYLKNNFTPMSWKLHIMLFNTETKKSFDFYFTSYSGAMEVVDGLMDLYYQANLLTVDSKDLVKAFILNYITEAGVTIFFKEKKLCNAALIINGIKE